VALLRKSTVPRNGLLRGDSARLSAVACHVFPVASRPSPPLLPTAYSLLPTPHCFPRANPTHTATAPSALTSRSASRARELRHASSCAAHHSRKDASIE